VHIGPEYVRIAEYKGQAARRGAHGLEIGKMEQAVLARRLGWRVFLRALTSSVKGRQ